MTPSTQWMENAPMIRAMVMIDDISMAMFYVVYVFMCGE